MKMKHVFCVFISGTHKKHMRIVQCLWFPNMCRPSVGKLISRGQFVIY